MARGFTSLPIVLLLASVPGGGYPGQRYPQGSPAQARQSTAKTLTGILRNIGDKNVVIEADDKTITPVAIANSTKYIGSSGGSAKIGDFQPGDHVSIGTNQDNNNAYHAATMTMVKEGTPEEHSIASLAADDPSHPLPGKSSGGSSANSSSSSGSSSANGSSGADSNQPQLRRAPSSTDSGAGVVASARPSLHAGDDVNGVTRIPSLPPPGAGSDGSAPAGVRESERMPAGEDPFIDQAKEEAFSFTETLPNYVVKQFTTRYAAVATRGGRTSWQTLDYVTADVIEEDGAEKYKNILVNGRAPRTDVEKSGSWSRGEFSSLQLDVLSPSTNADFHGKRSTTIANRAAFRYEFSVEQPNSHWHMEAQGQSYQPAYTGSIWIDKETYRVLRIELSARNLPRDFPLDQVESAVDYDYVPIGESKYLLPTHSEALSCAHSANSCTRNVIEFRNYKKFTADTSITFDGDK